MDCANQRLQKYRIVQKIVALTSTSLSSVFEFLRYFLNSGFPGECANSMVQNGG